MITVRILEGHSQETKQKIATGFTKTVMEATGLQREDIWIIFEDVAHKHWFTGDKDCT
jgi:phenylpyruvate tautomerase PptA (4-oxalocrotonate tautomerase family)